MIIVLADDITGAAEIAGISLRYGLKTSLVTGEAYFDALDSDTIVVATDIRSCTEETARRTTEKLCSKIKECRSKFDSKEIKVFKKTDSVLRGHISLELNCIMDCLSYSNALLVAQNPSKERIIKGSTYYIGGIKLSKTLFCKDPEYPALTSCPAEIVGSNSCMLPIDEEISKQEKTIYIAEASTREEIALQLGKANKECLLAGGADFFETFINKEYPYKEPGESKGAILQGDTMLVVSGSTQGCSIMGTRLMKENKGVEFTIPSDVFEGAAPEEWIKSIFNTYESAKAIVVRIGKHEFRGADYGNRLKGIIAEATKELLAIKAPRYLIIEGGATAFAILSRLGWDAFEVEHEFSSGVVGLKHGVTEIIMKPGSYHWGNLFC